MASLREFFLGRGATGRAAPRGSLPTAAPPGYAQSLFGGRAAKAGGFAPRGVGEQLAEGLGGYAVRGGPAGGLLEWAAKQTQKDVENATAWKMEKAAGGKDVIIKKRALWHPIKATKQAVGFLLKEPAKNFAWNIVKGASDFADRTQWAAVSSQTFAATAYVPVTDPQELAKIEGHLRKLKAQSQAGQIKVPLDDPTIREVVTWVEDPQANIALGKALEKRFSQYSNEAGGREIFQYIKGAKIAGAQPGIQDQVLHQELNEVFSQGFVRKSFRGEKTIDGKLFSKIEKQHQQGLVSDAALNFLKGVRGKHQFLTGARGGLGWAHDFWSGKWKRKVFWQGKIPFSTKRTPFAPGALVGKATTKLKGWLAKQAVGKAWVAVKEGIKKAAAQAAKWAARTAKKALEWVIVQGAKLAAKLGIKVAAHSAVQAVTQFFASAVPVVGNIIGGIIAYVGTEIGLKVLKYAAIGCAGFAFLMMMLFFLTFGSIIAALRGVGGIGGPGGVTTEPAVLEIISKTANPNRITECCSGAVHEITYTIDIRNRSTDQATGVALIDDYDEDNTTIVDGAGASDNGDELTWNVGDLDGGAEQTITYRTSIVADTDKVIVNTVTIDGDVSGEAASDVTSSFVIVGDPSGQPPSGWPTVSGCITQGPNTDDSHSGLEAIDTSYTSGADTVEEIIYATHDGTAYIYPDPPPFSQKMGNYVVVISPSGFSSVYGHLASFSVSDSEEVVRGTVLGVMDNTGTLTGGTHLHYHFRNLTMEPPYIPSEVPSCVGRNDCNLCFPCQDCPTE